MTTKWKIVSGFVIMVILIGIIVFLGYRGLQKSSEGFSEYRRLARLNVAISDMEIELNRLAAKLYAYIYNENEEHIDSAKKDLRALQYLIVDSEQFVTQPSTREVFSSLKNDTDTFDATVDSVRAGISSNRKQYEEVVLINAVAMINLLKEMGRTAESTQNVQGLGIICQVWGDLPQFMSSLSRFGNTHKAEDAATVHSALTQIKQSIGDLARFLSSPKGMEDMARINKAFTALVNAFTVMEKESDTLDKGLVTMNSFINTNLPKLRALNSEINKNMLSHGTQNLQNNESTQRSMLVTGLIGFIIGIATAVFIVLGIVRVLTQMSAFASSVSKGDFAYRISIKEKGEIGTMLSSVREIPSVLEKIIVTANNLAEQIRMGHLRNRFDEKTVPGEFSRLGVAINTVSAAFLQLIDAMPTTVMACSNDMKIIFANNTGQKILGSDPVGKNSREQINADSDSGQDTGRLSMERKSSVNTELTAHPQGKRMELSVSAIPLLDDKNNAAGFVEIITDITEIKDKQATMLKVAGEASAISDRVAAASEELAAQVEEISRGAEIQRSRVEGTASAMTEMNATVLEVAHNASQASDQSDDTRARAEQGAELVNKVVNSINKVNVIGNRLHENMQELGKQAEGIGSVMNVITDIADQTNLLALNAAIEAARAGEAGRGFAVVADEVRKLAEKTMSATKEVGSNITAIQHSARMNIEEVGNAVTSVREATDLAGSSGKSLEEIVNLASANSAIVASIATAAEEQSATSEEINRAIDEINRITGDTTDGMVQSSEAVQELSAMAQELKSVMQALR